MASKVNNKPTENIVTNNVSTENSKIEIEGLKDDSTSTATPGINITRETSENIEKSDDEILQFLVNMDRDDGEINEESPPLCLCHNMFLGSCPDNITATINLIKDVTRSGQANRDGVKCPVGTLNIPAWKDKLEHYHDKDDVVAGNEFGWELGIVADGPTPISSFKNHSSADDYSDSVDQYIKTELQHGTLCGPIPDNTGLNIVISPLATVPKPGSDNRRVIVDSSFPPGHGVNDAIPKNIYRGEYVKIKLPTVPDIVDGIRRTKCKYPGKKVKGFKCDLSRYYRFIPTCPRDWPKQCIRWRGKTYIDKAWSFGIRTAVQSAQRNTNAVNYCYATQECSGHASLIREALAIPENYSDEDIERWAVENPEELFNYIDDLIGISPDFLADLQWTRLQELLKHLGFKLSTTPGHLVPPSECFTALGIEFNIPVNLVRIPINKLEKGAELLNQWHGKEYASKHELQVLLGTLNHFSGCIKKGRLFVSRMLTDLREAYRSDSKYIKLSEGFKKDLSWWRDCMFDHNGYAILDHKEAGNIVTMDASMSGEVGGLPGVAAFNFQRNEFFHCPVPERLLGRDIADYELLVHLVSAKLWGPTWGQQEIQGHTDNMATHHLLKNGRSDSEFRLNIARELWFLETKFDFVWNSHYINTKNNHHSDSLSRWGDPEQRRKFYKLIEYTGAREIKIDDSLFNISQEKI